MSILKKKADHIVTWTPTCGGIREILRKEDYANCDLAIADGISTTVGHYHTSFDEIYMMLQGSIVLSFFDQRTERKWRTELNPEELCVIEKGLHHKILEGSPGNKLLVICVPGFDISDEIISEAL